MNRDRKLETKRNFYAPESMWRDVERVADDKFEGNFSMAVRYLVLRGLKQIGEEHDPL